MTLLPGLTMCQGRNTQTRSPAQRGMRFQIKRDRESREREMHSLMAREDWCGFGLGSEVVQYGPLPPQRPWGQQELTQIDKEKERDEERKSLDMPPTDLPVFPSLSGVQMSAGPTDNDVGILKDE
ncbi:hypothetical protein PAMP_014084 [Pampus punctatissimus]